MSYMPGRRYVVPFLDPSHQTVERNRGKRCGYVRRVSLMYTDAMDGHNTNLQVVTSA